MAESTKTSTSVYIKLLRRYGLLVGVIAVVCAVGAYVLSKGATPTYQAKASLIFQDEATALNVVGIAAAPSTSPDQLASLGAQEAVSAAVLQGVQSHLTPRQTLAQLTEKVSASPQQSSDLVVISATDHDAMVATRLADDVARATVARQQALFESEIQSGVTDLRNRLAALPKTPANAGTRSDYQDEILHLQAVKAVAQPAQISSYAALPTSPISPRPLRNAVIGGLLGIVLGLVAAFLRDATDRRLRGLDQIREQIDFPVVAAVPDHVLGSVMPSSASSERDAQEAARDLETFRILLANFDFLGEKDQIRTILVTSAMAAEGKSTIAEWLARACATGGQRTLLVECDFRRPTIASRLGLSSSPGLSDYLLGRAEASAILQPALLSDPAAELSANGSTNGGAEQNRAFVCIAAGSPNFEPNSLISSTKFASFVQETREAYDRVIIDTSPLLPVADTLQLLREVGEDLDGLLLCIRDQQTTRTQVKRAAELMAHLNEIPKAAVVTGVKPRDDETYGYYAYAYETA